MTKIVAKKLLALSVATGLIGLSPRTTYCSPGSAGCSSRAPYNDECSDPWFAGLSAWGHLNFKPACIRHDNCYHHGYCSYGKSKSRCDDDFLNDTRQICANLPLARQAERPMCETQAELFYRGVKYAPQAASSYLGAGGHLFCYEGMIRCTQEPCPKALCVLSVRRVGSSLWWWE